MISFISQPNSGEIVYMYHESLHGILHLNRKNLKHLSFRMPRNARDFSCLNEEAHEVIHDTSKLFLHCLVEK